MARRHNRSLGFVPLVLMALLWALVQWQFAAIGGMTSRRGYFDPEAWGPRYGCPIPEAAP